jgi:hypothetical protein
MEKPEEIKQFPAVEGGWLAGMQHHFVTVIVPDPTKKYEFSLGVKGREYILGAFGPALSVAPSSHAVFTENLFVGPKLQKQLITLNPELDHVAGAAGEMLLQRRPERLVIAMKCRRIEPTIRLDPTAIPAEFDDIFSQVRSP